MTELSSLSPAERAKRYRELEADAARQAGASAGETANAYLYLAKAWGRLAEITEELIARHATELPDTAVEQREAALRTLPLPDATEPK